MLLLGYIFEGGLGILRVLIGAFGYGIILGCGCFVCHVLGGV